jgi:hypothetical protein
LHLIRVVTKTRIRIFSGVEEKKQPSKVFGVFIVESNFVGVPFLVDP